MRRPTNASYTSNHLLCLFGEQFPDHGVKIALSNGSFIYKFGKGTKLFILSGVHGDERSGPISIIEYFSKHRNLSNIPVEFLVCPLLNTEGWDKNSRNYQNIDLNRSFNGEGPQFVKELMSVLKKERPSYFLDLHEDVDIENKNYIWVQEGCGSTFNKRVASETNMNLEYWSGNEKDWNFASSEEFIRAIGCKYAITSEVYSLSDLNRRVKKSVNIVSAVVEYISKVADEYDISHPLPWSECG